ncbi:MAG: hypothetical protein E6I80_05170 [Chloroflexi bacterium]|nr:MAG: hypothetical protein E6I80_05170 [Chloroflexota bacterium]
MITRTVRTFEFRLYPNRDQQHLLMKCLIESRHLYNEMLETEEPEYDRSSQPDATFWHHYSGLATFPASSRWHHSGLAWSKWIWQNHHCAYFVRFACTNGGGSHCRRL